MMNTVLTPPVTILTQLRSRTTYMSGKEVMTLIGVSRNTLCQWVRTGLIPALKIGKDYRYDPATLATWIEAHGM